MSVCVFKRGWLARVSIFMYAYVSVCECVCRGGEGERQRVYVCLSLFVFVCMRVCVQLPQRSSLEPPHLVASPPGTWTTSSGCTRRL